MLMRLLDQRVGCTSRLLATQQLSNMRLAFALILCCFSAPIALAAGATTLALASDYDYRGVTQSSRDPTAQLTLEWTSTKK